MAALLGTLPIAVSGGAGGEARRPLGLAVVGGLVVSQVLTLYITPVIYLYLERFQKKVSGPKGRGDELKMMELYVHPHETVQGD